MPFSALLDACVLYPGTLRDTLLRVAEVGIYQPLWSEKILDEVSDALLRNGAMDAHEVEYLNDCIREAFPDAIINGWEPLESAMRNDPKDRHVLAAAIRGHADVIVTMNLKDFPAHSLEDFDVEVQDPDTFLCYELEIAPSEIVQIIQEQAADTGRNGLPRWDAMGILTILERSGLKRFTSQCRLQIARIDQSNSAHDEADLRAGSQTADEG